MAFTPALAHRVVHRGLPAWHRAADSRLAAEATRLQSLLRTGAVDIRSARLAFSAAVAKERNLARAMGYVAAIASRHSGRTSPVIGATAASARTPSVDNATSIDANAPTPSNAP